MPVTIDQIDVDVSPAPASNAGGSSSSHDSAKPDPREVQKAIALQAARQARVCAN